MTSYIDKFTQEQQDIFKSITGNTIEELESDIDGRGEGAWPLVLSNQKFIESDLNSKGLHIYRILLSHNIYINRMPHPEVNRGISLAEAFAKDGFVIIRDFLDEDKLQYLKTVIDDMRINNKPAQDINFLDAVKRPSEQHAMNANDLFKSLIKVPEFGSDGVGGFPRTQMWHYKHTTDDPQYKWHTDTFQPTLKCWLYIDRITEENGVLSLIPKSHLPTENRLSWDYQKSIDHTTKDKSFRLAEFGTEEDEMKAIEENGFAKPIMAEGAANTLVAVNTYGFHKRGKSQPGVERNSLSLQYRPLAFSDYK